MLGILMSEIETYRELHGLGTSGPQLSGNDDLTTLGTALHNEPQNTVASSPDGQTVEQLVTEGLALSDGGQTAVLNLGGIERDRVLRELEALLDEGGKFTDAAALLTKNLLGVGSADDCRRASVSMDCPVRKFTCSRPLISRPLPSPSHSTKHWT